VPRSPARRCPNLGCPNTTPCWTHQAAPWKGSRRKSQLPPDWQKRRALVLDRDGHSCRCPGCRRCSSELACERPATDVDHVQPGQNHDLGNLRSLCRSCHGHKTAAEGNAARKKKQPPRGGRA
jgi:5-methylcytosine-specific restriction endonuclease McrA